jgi:hypothetical protein
LADPVDPTIAIKNQLFAKVKAKNAEVVKIIRGLEK